MLFIAGQIVGGLAILLGVYAFQAKEQKQLLYRLMLTNGVFAVHFLLLGAWTGAAINALSAARKRQHRPCAARAVCGADGRCGDFDVGGVVLSVYGALHGDQYAVRGVFRCTKGARQLVCDLPSCHSLRYIRAFDWRCGL